jgi:hypothetical protein
MSRGPGRIERAIEELFAGSPGTAFSTDEIVAVVYRGVNRIEKKHRVATLRAAHRVAKRRHWEKWQCERTRCTSGRGPITGRGAIFVNVLNLRSYAIGRLRTDWLHADESIEELVAMVDGGAEAEYIKPGGPWWIHVEQAKAKIGGHVIDPETQRLIDAHEQRLRSDDDALRATFRGPPEEMERRRRKHEANRHGNICARCGKTLKPDDIVVRQPTYTIGILGGRGLPLEVRCLDCSDRSGYWQRRNCDTCGREVHQRFRSNRRRTFCCDDCREHAPRHRKTAVRAERQGVAWQRTLDEVRRFQLKRGSPEANEARDGDDIAPDSENGISRDWPEGKRSA